MQVLLELGLVSEEELHAAIATEFNPSRISFLGGFNMWLMDVLNLGVVPRCHGAARKLFPLCACLSTLCLPMPCTMQTSRRQPKGREHHPFPLLSGLECPHQLLLSLSSYFCA